MILTKLIESFEGDLMVRYGDRLLPGARRALTAMKHCRDPQGPQLLACCDACHAQACLPHSCGHRSCPHCQHHESARWLARQSERRLPVDYFMVTFTLPRELRSLAWAHQRVVYGLMMQCAWGCLAQFGRSDKTLSIDLGATAVLHTHNRRRDFHPHVHLVVPAGGVDLKQGLWRQKGRYLFNARNLASVFRGKLLCALRKAGLSLPCVIPKQWVADCKNVGRGDKALGYLGRYLYRGVLSERDIVACEGGKVTFRYIESKTKQTRYRTLEGADFLWLLLQHVLPKGFRRARDYGLLHPRRKVLLKRVQCLLQVKLRPVEPPKRPAIVCPHCGAAMHVIRTRLSAALVRATAPRDWASNPLV